MQFVGLKNNKPAKENKPEIKSEEKQEIVIEKKDKKIK